MSWEILCGLNLFACLFNVYVYKRTNFESNFVCCIVSYFMALYCLVRSLL